jgi:serine/threonine protein kinase
VATVYSLEEVEGHLLLASNTSTAARLRAVVDDGSHRRRHGASDRAAGGAGLRAAHDAGVIHRDLKPENIIVGPGGTAKIVDFGIAWLESPTGTHHTKLTREGAMIGTPAYMAPEQLMGGTPDARTDIFAFGVILAEMLSGRHPLVSPASDSAATETCWRDSCRSWPTTPGIRIRKSASAARSNCSRCSRACPSQRARRRRRRCPATRGAILWEFHQGRGSRVVCGDVWPAWLAREQIGGLEGRGFFSPPRLRR